MPSPRQKCRKRLEENSPPLSDCRHRTGSRDFTLAAQGEDCGVSRVVVNYQHKVALAALSTDIRAGLTTLARPTLNQSLTELLRRLSLALTLLLLAPTATRASTLRSRTTTTGPTASTAATPSAASTAATTSTASASSTAAPTATPTATSTTTAASSTTLATLALAVAALCTSRSSTDVLRNRDVCSSSSSRGEGGGKGGGGAPLKER
ncbi:unnamed protein product [Closterium sp. NIES-54]